MRVVIVDGRIVEGDLEVIRKGGKFEAIINGHKGIFQCDPNYVNVKYIKDETPNEINGREQPTVGDSN